MTKKEIALALCERVIELRPLIKEADKAWRESSDEKETARLYFEIQRLRERRYEIYNMRHALKISDKTWREAMNELEYELLQNKNDRGNE